MKLMSSKIYLRNVRFHAFHGVLPQEGWWAGRTR